MTAQTKAGYRSALQANAAAVKSPQSRRLRSQRKGPKTLAVMQRDVASQNLCAGTHVAAKEGPQVRPRRLQPEGRLVARVGGGVLVLAEAETEALGLAERGLEELREFSDLPSPRRGRKPTKIAS